MAATDSHMRMVGQRPFKGMLLQQPCFLLRLFLRVAETPPQYACIILDDRKRSYQLNRPDRTSPIPDRLHEHSRSAISPALTGRQDVRDEDVDVEREVDDAGNSHERLSRTASASMASSVSRISFVAGW